MTANICHLVTAMWTASISVFHWFTVQAPQRDLTRPNNRLRETLWRHTPSPLSWMVSFLGRDRKAKFLNALRCYNWGLPSQKQCQNLVLNTHQGRVLAGRRCVRLFPFSSAQVRSCSKWISDELSSLSEDKPSRRYAFRYIKKVRMSKISQWKSS